MLLHAQTVYFLIYCLNKLLEIKGILFMAMLKTLMSEKKRVVHFPQNSIAAPYG